MLMMMAMMVRLTLLLIFLLLISGVFGEKFYVIYDTTTICVLKGSTVNMSCSYIYPEQSTLNNTFWMKCKTLNEEIRSLKEYPEYKDRVEYIEDRQMKTATLRLHNVTQNDENTYCFRLTTGTDKQKWIGYPGIQVSGARNVMYVFGLCVIIGTAAGFGTLFLLIIYRWNKRRNDDSKDTKLKKTSAGKVSTSGDGDKGLYATVQRQDKVMKKPDKDEIQYASITIHCPATETKSPQSQENDFSVIYSGLIRQADPLSI
ncbi:uncharacterized protein LOC127444620 isoform X2 [Myxocyprinus asiaticus]|uniref:uncharacterized protein LOC127444620 isoform X2 n=1 Tax=Myxocyprinus asiaticus TaxID=70543 RepID=UPI00222135CA|nr:uncharacterized protein LOC127444620 isoform X2 [Myxocyprinus asiaticus]